MLGDPFLKTGFPNRGNQGMLPLMAAVGGIIFRALRKSGTGKRGRPGTGAVL